MDGPRLGLPGGVADHVVIQTPGGIVVVGGETQHERKDTELSAAFLLAPPEVQPRKFPRKAPGTLTVRRLPDTPIAHDDAAGFGYGNSAVVLGGQVKASLLGATVPTPIRAVDRIELGDE